MIEHEAHVGSKYHEGIKGQRIAIVGFSHWLGDEDEDDNALTKNCVRNVITGKNRLQFFTKVRNYFGSTDHEDFWNRVMFFNLLPDCVGGPDKRFRNGTPEQISRGQKRFLRLIWAERPHKVFVFTSRKRVFPETPIGDEPLDPPILTFSKRTYQQENLKALAFFLRHPLGANGELMRAAVSQALALSPLI